MKVSVITVTYNSARTLEYCIRSVAEQSHPDLEYLILDGESKDQSISVIRNHEDKISKWVSEPDNGMYDAMNKGISMATGDLIGFLHADDIYTDPDVISDITELMNKDQSDACYADLCFVDPENTDNVVRFWESGEYKAGSFLNGWMPPHPTFFVRRQVYEELGGYRTDMGTAADYELMLRYMYKEGIKVSYLPRTIIEMRTGGLSNASVQHRLRANRMDRKAWEVNGLKPRPWTLVLKPLRKIQQFI